MVDFKSLGHNIRKYRVEAALSQDELAEACGCCGSYIGKIENGKSLPSLEIIVKLADALDTTVDHLLSDKPPKTELSILRDMEERLQRLPSTTRIDACRSLSNLLSIVEDLHNS